jgi:hypothetical protein
MINQKVLNASISYEAYEAQMEAIVAKSHHISIHLIEDSTHAVRMNLIKMERLDKAARITASTRFFIVGYKKELIWLVLSHPESEDAAQVLPILNKIATLSSVIKFKIAPPEINEKEPDLAKISDASYPKLLIIDPDDLRILATWGPYSAELMAVLALRDEALKAYDSPQEKAQAAHSWATKIQRWYAKDKTYSIQKELLEILKNL